MPSITPETLLDQLRWRYAVKSFDPERKIDAATWAALETTLQLTPSSYGMQPWKFLVVQDEEIKKELRAASWNQSQVSDCSHFVVFTHHPEVEQADINRFLDSLSAARGIPRENLDRYGQVIAGDLLTGARSAMIKEWTSRQCYIALGNFMTAAALIGVDTCPMEGLSNSKYDEILGLKGTRFRTVVACAAGYRSAADKTAAMPKMRYPLAEVLERR